MVKVLNNLGNVYDGDATGLSGEEARELLPSKHARRRSPTAMLAISATIWKFFAFSRSKQLCLSLRTVTLQSVEFTEVWPSYAGALLGILTAGAMIGAFNQVRPLCTSMTMLSAATFYHGALFYCRTCQIKQQKMEKTTACTP